MNIVALLVGIELDAIDAEIRATESARDEDHAKHWPVSMTWEKSLNYSLRQSGRALKLCQLEQERHDLLHPKIVPYVSPPLWELTDTGDQYVQKCSKQLRNL